MVWGKGDFGLDFARVRPNWHALRGGWPKYWLKLCIKVWWTMFGFEDLSLSALWGIVGFGVSLLVLFLFQGLMSSRQSAREAARKQHALQLEILKVQKELAKSVQSRSALANVQGLGIPARPLRKLKGQPAKTGRSSAVPAFRRA